MNGSGRLNGIFYRRDAAYQVSCENPKEAIDRWFVGGVCAYEEREGDNGGGF